MPEICIQELESCNELITHLITLRLILRDTVKTEKTIFMKDSKCFNINDIDINKVRVSEAKVFMRENNSYKHYIFYEDGDKYNSLNICFSKTLAAYYNECGDVD